VVIISLQSVGFSYGGLSNHYIAVPSYSDCTMSSNVIVCVCVFYSVALHFVTDRQTNREVGLKWRERKFKLGWTNERVMKYIEV
jgi:hypothetical protein